MINKDIQYPKLKKDIERLMKATLKEVREETLCAELLKIFLQARELLDGNKPSGNS